VHLFSCTYNGINWAGTTSSISYYSLSFKGLTGYIAYSNNELLKTTDGGLNWSVIPFTPGTATHLFAKTADTVFASTSQDLFVSNSGGQYWDRYHLAGVPTIEDIRFFDSQNGVVVGQNAYLLRTTNGGGNAAPFTSFSFPAGTLCSGNPVQFTNLGNPAYTYQWNFGGAGSSAAYAPSFTFANAGTYNVQLTATGSNGVVDSATIAVTITASPDVLNFNAQASPDSVCYNAGATVSIPNSQNGVTYTLRDGYTAMGSSQTGNGSTLNFPTGNLVQQVNLNVKGQMANSCATDSVVVQIPLTVLIISPLIPSKCIKM